MNFVLSDSLIVESKWKRRMAHLISFAFVACLILIGSVKVAESQVLYGSLTGNINDSSGAVIPNVSVKAVNTDTGFNRTEQTNGSGIYKFSDLTPGTYTLTISLPGYGTFKKSGLLIEVNTLQRADATLEIGAVTQSIDVTGSAPSLQTDSAQTAFTLETKQIAALPTTSTAGRNFQSLFKIIPGSTPPAESNSAAGNPQRAQVYNVNGITNTTNSTRLDGAVDSYPTLPSLVAYLPPTDGISSINIVTGSFNAEQGSAGGAAVNVTIKSGTNQFHGSIWEYNSITQFSAQAWQNRTGVRKNLLNEFGLSVGGPIFRDKLFFFADWDRVKTSKIAIANLNTSSIPSQVVGQGGINAAGAADFSNAFTVINNVPILSVVYDPQTGKPFAGNIIPSNRLAPASLTLLSKLPKPTNAGTQYGAANNYSAYPTTRFIRDNIDSKITYNPTTKTGYFGHYSLSPDTIVDPQLLNLNGGTAGGLAVDGGQPGTSTGLIQNIGLNATHLFTQNVLLDADFGFTRQRVTGQADDITLGDYGLSALNIPGTNNGGDPNYAGIPGFFLTGYDSIGNAMTSSPFKYRDNQETGNVNLSYTHGKHSFRFGSEYLHAALNHLQPGQLSAATSTPRGGFTFNGAVTTIAGGASPTQYNSLADFVLGLPQLEGKQIQLFNPLTLRYSEFSFFAQDTWEATPALTVNYGVRYEYYPLISANHYGTIRFDPTVQTMNSDINGTHNVGTTLVGGQGATPLHAGINNHSGTIVPRLGLSYRIDSKTVVRGGFGITVDPESLRSNLNAYPQAIGLTQNASGHAAAASLNAPTGSYIGNPGLLVGLPQLPLASIQGQFSTGVVPLPSNISSYTIPKDFRRGYIESFNVAVQHQFPKNMVATISYVGSHAVRQQTLYDLNASAAGGGNAGRFLNLAYGANNSNSDIYSILPFQGSVYNGLQTQLTSQGGRLIQYGVVYTYSKAEDAADNGQLGTLMFVDPAQIGKNYGLAGYDRKHNFQFWSILQSPFGKGSGNLRSSPLKFIAGGWQLTNILSRVSGTPFNVTASGTSLNAPGNTQVADYLAGNARILSSNIDGNRQYLNPAAYAAVTTARFGNSGRDGVRGPGIFNIDTSLVRSFPLYSEANLSLQADAFNITNTPQFANPSSNVSAGGFGVITASNSNRTMRLSARITF